MYYTGNEYLYTNLSRITNGAYRNHLQTWFDENNDALFSALSLKVGMMDLYTSLQNGFCFNRFHLGEQTELTNFNQTIRQVGKYSGEFPFIIEIAGELDQQVFFDGTSIAKENIGTGDITTKLVWSGEFIKKLEKEVGPIDYQNSTLDRQKIYDLINRSIQDRILSFYTAFLALEPSQGGEICTTCVDESAEVLVHTSEQALDSILQVDILSNPFREKVQINVQFKRGQTNEDFQFRIYNTRGQLLKSFHPDRRPGNHHLQLIWDGTQHTGQALASGMYLFTISGPQGQASWRLLKL